MRHQLIKTTILAISLILITGCNKEKAAALLTAVKSFEAQSTQALDAYQELFKDYSALTSEPKEELFNQAYASAALSDSEQAVGFEDAMSNLGQLKNSNLTTRIEKDFQQLKSAYSMLRSTYEALPQGDLLGAQYVSCGQTAVAKLTKQLVNFSTDINRSPLYPATLRQSFYDFKSLASKGEKDKAKQKFDEIYNSLSIYEKKHGDALLKTLAAVEQGQRLNSLLAQYDSITISNILAFIQYGYTFAGTLNGVDVSRSAASLSAIKADMAANDYWKRVELTPLAKIGECTIQADKKDSRND